MTSFFRKIPGFRSGEWWRIFIALSLYLFILFTILTVILPSAPPLVLDKMDPSENVLIPDEGAEQISIYSRYSRAKVIKVIDGDTIKIEGDKVVRYIGIDAPETIHSRKPVQCYGKEASNKNRELVEGKEVKLEKDISETDKYGRLLRYIWLDDMLVNEYLVRKGYAQSSTYPPDVKYQDRFLDAQRQAREENKGLWGDICNPPEKVQSSRQINLNLNILRKEILLIKAKIA